MCIRDERQGNIIGIDSEIFCVEFGRDEVGDVGLAEVIMRKEGILRGNRDDTALIHCSIIREIREYFLCTMN